MKLLKYCLFAMAPLGTLSAATYSFDEPEYVPNASLTTVPGWTTSASSPANEPMAWVGSLNGSKAAAVGGYYSAPATGSSFAATIATPSPLNGAVVSFDVSIRDSTNLYPDRDTFGLTVSDTSGGMLAMLTFNPLNQSDTPQGGLPAEWEVSYTVAGGETFNTTISLFEGGLASMSLAFNSDSFVFTLGAFSFTEENPAYDVDALSIGSVSLTWDKPLGNGDFGDNFMVVDNLTVVPEPSVALLGGVGVFFLMRRRRAA